MNNELLQRMKIAGEYQKKAIQVLFPEKINKHLEVIEREWKMMIAEVATELMKECNKSEDDSDRQEQEQAAKVKKVNIV